MPAKPALLKLGMGAVVAPRCSRRSDEKPGAEHEQNTKRIRREYEENTKNIREQLLLSWLVPGLFHAFPWLPLGFRPLTIRLPGRLAWLGLGRWPNGIPPAP